MGTYYNPPKVVREKGKRVYMTGNEMPKFDKSLVAYIDRLIFDQAVLVSDPEEFEEFHKQHRQGMFLTFELYDVDPEELQ